MSNRGGETDRSGMTTGSTDSSSGSGTLLDAFVAVEAPKGSMSSR